MLTLHGGWLLYDVARSDLIIDLYARDVPPVGQAGGKARNLFLLHRRGFPVPPGFCITCAAYEHHTNERSGVPLRDAVQRLLKDKKTGRPGLLARIRVLITEPALDPVLLKELLKYYRKLSAPFMAVRSSATAEDQARRSFAGQYETVLGVSSFEGLQSAVKRCWASLYSDRTYEYCRKNNIDHAALGMAVIVQQQVAANFAGVVFTSDPATGDRNRIAIEYCEGLGDKLVSGRVAPKRLMVDKARMRMSAGDPPGPGTIDPAIIKQLARHSMRIEKEFGGPQDIEWAVAGKKIIFLQTRPVTTGDAQVRPEQRQIWTNANTGEVLPDVITPMTWSMVVPYVTAIFNALLDFIGANSGDIVIFGRIAGRAYFNLNSLAGMLRSIPGFRKFDITSVFGGEQGSMGDLGTTSLAEEDIPRIRFKLSRACLFLPLRALRFLFFNVETGMKILARHRSDVARLDQLDLSTLEEERLFELLRGMNERIFSTIRQLGFIAVAMMFYTNLDKICRKWFYGKPGEHSNPLLAGIGGIEPAKAGLALYELSRICRQNPALLRRVGSRESWDRIRPRLGGIKGGKEFLRAWQDFMVRHGHHTRSEIELIYPRWSESPDFILAMVRNYLKTDDATGNPVERYERAADRRIKLTAELRQRLRNPVKRMIFDYFLRKAQQGSVFRENMKNMFMRVWIVIRRIILEFGERLRRRGVISKAEDIFFLEIHEIEPLLNDPVTTRVHRLIKTRRAEYRQYRAITPPKVIMGSFDPEHFVPDPVTPTKRQLTGLAASPGVVRGKARVILDTRSKEKVRPGEILVAPFTDPGWTPYFMSAAAIVVDMGGLLSHGSIVAREYGIPAVVNVGPATQLIKTGKLVEVDGDRGVVRLIEQGKRKP